MHWTSGAGMQQQTGGRRPAAPSWPVPARYWGTAATNQVIKKALQVTVIDRAIAVDIGQGFDVVVR